jgi:DNA-binding MarR family transcriptional regulator
MAKTRQVSRQHIQALVQPLCAEGMVQLTFNPAHRRSKLVRLTAAGRAAIEAILVSETGLFAEVARDFSPLELVRVAATLRRLAHCFEDSRTQGRDA